ncbi:MAG: hypothetical protein ACTS3F_02080 [Phycisphaerales bacterium]
MSSTRTKSPAKAQLKRAIALRDEGALFPADRAAHQAITSAMKQGDFNTVADAVKALAEIRAAIRQQAIATGELIELDQWPEGAPAAIDADEEPSPAKPRRTAARSTRSAAPAATTDPDDAPDDPDEPTADADDSTASEPIARWTPKPAAYLVRPPLVGADGRTLRDFAERREIPAFVIVREPTTRMNLWPVVMIGPAVVRVRIPPPHNDEPTIEWMLHAQEQLASEAIRECETEERHPIRLELLMERIATLHYDQALFEATIETAKAHARALRKESTQRKKSSTTNKPTKSTTNPNDDPTTDADTDADTDPDDLPEINDPDDTSTELPD